MIRRGFAALALACVACGGGGSEGARFLQRESGIRAIYDGDVNITEGTGGYYVIGGCDDRDAAETNVTSLGSDGRTLFSPRADCPGAPFEIRVTPIDAHTVRTEVTIGPLPVDYATLSVPLDVRAHLVDTFSTDVAPLFVGGCGEVERRNALDGHFDSVPTPCPPGVRVVGLAETRTPAGLAVIEGPGTRVIRRILGGDAVKVQFFRNLPIDVENSEVAFGPRRAGSVVTLVEEITVD